MSRDSSVIRYREYLKRLSYPEYAYRQATNELSGAGYKLDLSLWNDSLPHGVAEAVARALPKTVGSYALAQDRSITDGLAERLGVPNSSIIMTAGADDALRAAAQYCIRPGTSTLIPTPCFGRYVYHAMINEAQIHYLPFNTYPYEFDIPKLIAEIRRKNIACLFIANPNNPTGHLLPRQAIIQLLDAVSCSVILDESLAISLNGGGNAISTNDYPHLFVCGSFSKIYGLAGLRLGYIVANRAHTRQLRQLVSPFSVDALALEIAKYVFSQSTWLRRRIARINKGIAMLRSIDSPRLRVTHTQAPVALLDYEDDTRRIYQMLHTAGVLTVAGQEFPGLAETNAVRVIIKNEQDMLRLKEILAELA